MSSRDNILRRIESQQVPEKVYDDSPYESSFSRDWSVYEQSLMSVGGSLVQVRGVAEVEACIRERAKDIQAKKVASTFKELGVKCIELLDVDDPHELEDLDLFIAAGEVAVAENGAIWIGHGVPHHRVALFINQHLVIVLKDSDLVPDMHAAYDRIDFSGLSYGTFISGPSKTADIEQSLVIGAHGPRSLLVIVDQGAE